jgi:hypothetical protein
MFIHLKISDRMKSLGIGAAIVLSFMLLSLVVTAILSFVLRID